MKRLAVIFFLPAMFCLLISGCREFDKKDSSSLKTGEMIKADEDFSTMSRQSGMKKAFIEYIDEEGILLRPNHPPIIGADAIEFLSQLNDTAYTLTWKPSGGELSAAGDLGYTYGLYTLQLTDTVIRGTYVSIWKKQQDGKWKFVLDSGNEGITDEPIGQ